MRIYYQSKINLRYYPLKSGKMRFRKDPEWVFVFIRSPDTLIDDGFNLFFYQSNYLRNLYRKCRLKAVL